MPSLQRLYDASTLQALSVLAELVPGFGRAIQASLQIYITNDVLAQLVRSNFETHYPTAIQKLLPGCLSPNQPVRETANELAWTLQNAKPKIIEVARQRRPTNS